MKWINVKNGLPKENKTYLVYGETIGFNLAYFIGGSTDTSCWCPDGEDFDEESITHWAELKKPTK